MITTDGPPFAMGTLDRGDAALRFDSLGDGPVALLLHAGGERRRVWHKVMTPLAERRFATIAYDQRGHGDSGGSRDTPLPLFGADTAAMIRGLAAPIVVGASLGGFAALSALADQAVQDGVAGLILVDVVPDPDPAVVRAFLDLDGRAASHAFQVEDILGRAAEMRAAAAMLQLPVLLIRAGRGVAITDVDAERFRGLVPQAIFNTIPDSSHLVARDQPLVLAEVIGDFMSSDPVCDRRVALLLAQGGLDRIGHQSDRRMAFTGSSER